MKRVLNGYIITYIIDIALTFICMMLLIYYSLSMSIGWTYAGLFGGFQFDLAQLWLIIFLSILLIVSLFALVIYLIITVKQSRKQQLEKSAKLGVIIVPVIFCMLLPVATGISVALTPSEPLDNEWLCSDERFKEWNDEDSNHPIFEYYSQENVFGKVVDIDHSVSFVDENNELKHRSFECYFRNSEISSIFRKFSKRPPQFFDESYNAIQDNIPYTLYSHSDEDSFSYCLIIENVSTYLFAEYYSEEAEIISNYTLDDFIDDVLDNYNAWNKE